MKTRLSSLIFVITLASSLAGCGFQPLYGNLQNGENVAQELASIEITPVGSRLGVALRSYLLDTLQPAGRAANPQYRLAFRLKEGQVGAGERLDASVTRYTYRLTVAYKLSNTKTGKKAYEGQSFSSVSYDVVDSQFATVVSREDAQDRAVREVSEDIKLRLALYLNQQDQAPQSGT